MNLDSMDRALEDIDWVAVVLTGGPPCFYIGEGDVEFCFRAERWHTSKLHHKYVSLKDFVIKYHELSTIVAK